MEEDDAPARIRGLAFAEAGVAALTRIGARQPLHGEQRPLGPPTKRLGLVGWQATALTAAAHRWG
jgi:hypothetical protein